VSFASHLSGHTALIEPEEHSALGRRYAEPLTGTVDNGDDGDDGPLIIVGVSPSDIADGTEVMVSVFSPDALYRIRAGVRWVGPGRLAIDPVHDVEQIQRRRWPRHELHLDVTLLLLADAAAASSTDHGALGVAGRTLDIGMGGLRVETPVQFSAGTTVSLTLMLPDGAPLVARATVVASDSRNGSFEHRLAFDQLDDLDTTNLAALLDPRSTAADIRRKAASAASRDH
jgi:hypothetical protein